MPQVSDKVLGWLYNVLQTYPDQQRTYSDAARVLQNYPTLSPRTEVYTYESGASSLLLTFTGTLSVSFRGTIYNFPVRLWIPQEYPREPPMAYVMPDRDLQIRAGQHVSVDGRVYHPYLRDWSTMWDRASIADFLEYLQQAFAKEPPLISRSHQQQFQRSLEAQGRAPVPSLPPKGYENRRESLNAPPRPPKPGQTGTPELRDVTRDGPPLPPLPSELPAPRDLRPAPVVQTYSPKPYEHPPQRTSSSQHNYNQPQIQQPQSQYYAQQDTGPVSPIQPTGPHGWNAQAQHQRPYQRPAQTYPPQHTNGQRQGAYAQQPAQPQQKLPAPDLLSDPFDIALSSTAPIEAPPIPPNPEKEHLLQALSATCVQQAQQKINQNYSAIAPLQAQSQALHAARARLEAELAQLESLDAVLASNEAILHRSIQDCDRAIANAKSQKQPPINEVLIAPTLVAQQLWSACADEAACREAMYALQNAVDKGRVSGVDFVRHMRGLGRECFLKMALARKCARGLGLEVDR